ncbi:nitroreductase family protein [Bacillus sp. Marseille-P3661]|uniref:nitroreductase family protein n=1 Tax=Bacillus sp. Marseille-P3661 TaxID=1936234 RepID=UPI000C85E02A|nr:nitroreductase family protein [Bacillus sp. Marseille-P3661]
MDVFKAIEERREITSFTDKKIQTDILEKLLQSAYLAPSGNNLPSREFIVVTAKEKLLSLSNSTPYVPWLTTSQAAIVITGRPDVSKYWLQDASIASGFIWLQAVESGLGVGFGAIYHSEDPVESKKREDYVRAELSIPSDRRIVAILGLGYQDTPPQPKKLLARDTIIYYEKFNLPEE